MDIAISSFSNHDQELLSHLPEILFADNFATYFLNKITTFHTCILTWSIQEIIVFTLQAKTSLQKSTLK